MAVKRITLIFALIVVVLSVSYPGLALNSPRKNCNDTQDWNFCVAEIQLLDPTISKGERLTVTVTVQNTGNRTGTVDLLLGVTEPNGRRFYPESKTVRDVRPNESRQVTVRWNPDSVVFGKYQIHALLLNPPANHLFDSTGQTTFIVERRSLWDWFRTNAGAVTVVLTILSMIAGTVRWWQSKNS